MIMTCDESEYASGTAQYSTDDCTTAKSVLCHSNSINWASDFMEAPVSFPAFQSCMESLATKTKTWGLASTSAPS